MTTDLSLIDTWYGKYLPYNFQELPRFSKLSNELTREIIKTPIVIDTNATSPYMKDGKSYLPGIYFVAEYYVKILDIKTIPDAIKSAIALINGSQIHEALHHLLLGADAHYHGVVNKVKYYIKSTGKLRDEKVLDTIVLKDCFNIVEDMFTENYGLVNYPHIHGFNRLMAEILFSKKSFDKTQMKLSNKSVTHVDVMNYLVHFKHEPYFEVKNKASRKYAEHITILKTAQDVSLTLEQRFELSVDLYNLLKQEHGKQEGFNQQLSDSARERGVAIDSDGKLEQSGDKGTLDILRTQVKKKLDDIEREMFTRESSNITNIPSRIVDVMKSDKAKDNRPQDVEYNNQFMGFWQYVQNARAMKESYVQPRMTGNKILTNRLATAMVDGKILAKRDVEIMNRGVPELIFLLDLSGSMRTKLLKPVINAGYTIFDSLQNNNIPCAFYGHTTDRKNCLIVAIAAHNMPLLTNFPETHYDSKERFEHTHAWDNNDNGDGFAIETVGKRFTDRPGKKVLIVLSDGYPACSIANYYGDMGINHTKESAENLRKSNISVVSLSLVGSVVETNNVIYGEENNIAAYGTEFESNMKKLIANIVI